MALKQDQRAMLQLLLERGQSYDDLASLLDLEAEEVRARARAALTELAGSDPDSDVALTDYLLGQADPIGRADVVRHLRADPDARDRASELAAKLQMLIPGAELPELPAPKGRRPARREPADAAAASGEEAASRPGLLASLSRRQTQAMAGIGALAVIVIVGVLALSGAFGGGGDGSGDETNTQTTASSEGVARVPLEPTGGGRAKGQIVFARSGDQPVMQINITGLDDPQQGQLYVLWMYNNRREAFPIGALAVRNGVANAQQVLPAELTRVLPAFRFLDISLSDANAVNARLREANSSKPIPGYSGKSILRGDLRRAASQAGTNLQGGTGGTGPQGGP